MQDERHPPNSFTETIDLNQVSFPSNNSTEYPAPWNNIFNPVDNRLSSYVFASRDGFIRDMNGSNSLAQNSSAWERGESSSQTNHLLNRACHDDSEKRLGWSSTMNACSATNARSVDRSLEISNFGDTIYSRNHVARESPLVQNHRPNIGTMNLSSSQGNVRENIGCVDFGSGASNPQYVSGISETEQFPAAYASSSEVGSSHGSSSKVLENSDESPPFLGTWGSSCKRKALEVTSRQFYQGRSSSLNQHVDSVMKHSNGGCSAAPVDLNSSSGPQNLSLVNHSVHPNVRGEVGVRRVPPTFVPASNTSRVGQIPATIFPTNFEHHDSNLFETPRSPAVRYSNVYGYPLSSPGSDTVSSGLRPPVSLQVNPTNMQNNSHSMNLNENIGFLSPPWSRSASRGGGSPSFMLFEESSGEREEVNIRNSLRNYPEYPVIVPAPETRNIFRDEIDWSFSPRTPGSSRNHSSGSQIGSSSGGWGFPGALLRYQNQSSQNYRRLLEVAPWIPSSNIDSDSGIQRSRFTYFPTASSSSDDAAMASRAQHHSDQRSAASSSMPGNDINGRRALSAVERRQRLIRPVLSAMRRAAHLQAEDYMLIDPFANGFAELHDRYRDMRLDVDNMSYEELLALEDRIGNVSTGLDEEKISSSVKQRMYQPTEFSLNVEPCCICQEDYIAGDGMGILDCGHEFHIHCIKQWLFLKNLCPVCKLKALAT